MKNTISILLLLFTVCAFSQNTTGNLITLNGGMTVKLDTNNTTATLTFTGPDTSWLGIGFGGTSMGSVTDMFIWNDTANRDYTPSGNSTPSADAVQSWVIVSDAVSGTTRTVVATRDLVSAGNYTFTNDSTPVPVITNRGFSETLAYHGFNTNRTITNITRAVLGVDENELNKPLAVVYPNPANEYFEVRSMQKITKIQLFDATGKNVKNYVQSNQYDISSLQSGVYFLEIIMLNGESQFEKLIKN